MFDKIFEGSTEEQYSKAASFAEGLDTHRRGAQTRYAKAVLDDNADAQDMALAQINSCEASAKAFFDDGRSKRLLTRKREEDRRALAEEVSSKLFEAILSKR